MSNVTRVKVTQKYQLSDRASKEEKERAFKGLLTAFKKQCAEAGIAQLVKRYERYEKPSEKKHRKRRSQELERTKVRQLMNNRSNKRK